MRRRRATDAGRYRVAEGVVVQQTADEVTFFRTRRASYWQGNGTAARVVGHLQDGWSVAEVVDRLSEDYEVAPDVLRRDVTAVVDALLAARLVVPTIGGVTA